MVYRNSLADILRGQDMQHARENNSRDGQPVGGAGAATEVQLWSAEGGGEGRMAGPGGAMTRACVHFSTASAVGNSKLCAGDHCRFPSHLLADGSFPRRARISPSSHNLCSLCVCGSCGLVPAALYDGHSQRSQGKAAQALHTSREADKRTKCSSTCSSECDALKSKVLTVLARSRALGLVLVKRNAVSPGAVHWSQSVSRDELGHYHSSPRYSVL